MREIINFNTKWAFTKDADTIPAVMPEKWYWVTLPHSWNALMDRMAVMIIIAEPATMQKR